MVIRIVLSFVFAFIFFLRKRWKEREAFKNAPHPANRPSLINDFCLWPFLAHFFLYDDDCYKHLFFENLWAMKLNRRKNPGL